MQVGKASKSPKAAVSKSRLMTSHPVRRTVNIFCGLREKLGQIKFFFLIFFFLRLFYWNSNQISKATITVFLSLDKDKIYFCWIFFFFGGGVICVRFVESAHHNT